MNSNQLPENEYSVFNATYIKALENVELLEELEISLHDFIRFVREIPMDKFDYRYAEGKWTIKEILQHIKTPKWDRIFRIKDALMMGVSVNTISKARVVLFYL